MKKKLTFFLMVVYFVSSLLYASSSQKIYTVRDDVYRRVDELCRRAGVLGPSSFSPMSSNVFLIALDRIDEDSLSISDQREYGELYSKLTEDESLFESGWFSFDADLGANLAINIASYSEYDFTNSDKSEPYFDRREDVLLPYRYTMPALKLGGEVGFGDNVFLEVDFDLGNNSKRLYETSFGWLYTSLGDNPGFGLNFPFEIPLRAGGSFGNDYVSFIVGRFPHSMGSGITGNMTVGDNFIYQEIGNLSFISNYFSYNISVTRFDQQVGIVDTAHTDVPPQVQSDHLTTFSRNEFSGMQQFRVVHRFDLNMFNKVRFALNLSTLYNSSNGLDIRFFAPFVIAHNYYNYDNTIEKKYFDEANNLIGLELEVSVIKGLGLSFQAAIDQMQMFFEPEDFPPAYGVLGNLKYSTNLGSGNLEIWFEGAYTNPYLYLNEKRNADGSVDYNLDYVVGYHMRGLEDYGYSGYVYGPDTMVFSLGGKFSSARFEVGGNILYRIKGEKALKYKSSIIDMSNSHLMDGDDASGTFSNAITPSGGLNSAEQLLKFACYGIYHLERGAWGEVSFYLASGFNTYFNHERVQGKVKFQPELMFGATYVF